MELRPDVDLTRVAPRAGGSKTTPALVVSPEIVPSTQHVLHMGMTGGAEGGTLATGSSRARNRGIFRLEVTDRTRGRRQQGPRFSGHRKTSQSLTPDQGILARMMEERDWATSGRLAAE